MLMYFPFVIFPHELVCIAQDLKRPMELELVGCDHVVYILSKEIEVTEFRVHVIWSIWL